MNIFAHSKFFRKLVKFSQGGWRTSGTSKSVYRFQLDLDLDFDYSILTLKYALI